MLLLSSRPLQPWIRPLRLHSSFCRLYSATLLNLEQKRPPLKETEMDRGPFEARKFTLTKTPDPDWTEGQGRTGKHPRSAEFDAATAKTVYDVDSMSTKDKYKMLVGTILPRPIALVSSQALDGTRNLAPFSYFGAACHDPPTVMISMNFKQNGPKDSLSNILETKIFTVNIISEPFAEAANCTSVDAPSSVDEWLLSGLTPIDSAHWGKEGPPRVGESAVSLECELSGSMPLNNDSGIQTSTIVLGRIRKYVLNEGIRQADGSISPDGILPVSRGGGITYFTTSTGFELPRSTWAERSSR